MDRSSLINDLQSKIDSVTSGKSGGSLFSADADSRERIPAQTRIPGQEGGGAGKDAFKKILDFLNARDRSEHALRLKLAEKGFTEEEIDEGIQRAKDYGFVNDARYADVLIRSRIAQGKGAVGIERELRAQHIDPLNVEGWPYEYEAFGEAETQRALKLLERKPPRSKNPREAAFRKLVNNGYSTSCASSAARAWAEAHSL